MDFMVTVVEKAGVDPKLIEKMVSGMRGIASIWESVPVDRMVRFNTNTKLAMGGARWDVIHAPGHSESQTCFYEPISQQLISADMLLHIAPVPVIERQKELNAAGEVERILGLPRFMQSLEMFYELDVSAVYPGHGPEFKDPHRVVIDRQRDRIGKRKEQCYGLVAEGHRTIKGITDVMYSHFPEGSKITGLAMVVGYTDLLMQDNRISRTLKDGVWQFEVI